MIKIVIPFDDPSPNGPPFNTDSYKKGYSEFSKKARDQDMEVYFSRGKDAHKGNGVFDSCYVFKDDELLLVGKIKADVVFDKSKYLQPDGTYRCINNQQIKKICKDKMLTYKYFPDISPDTQEVSNSIELQDKLSNTKGIVVLKPIDGSAGVGVIIDEVSKIKVETINTYPILFQQFIDSSQGIPGLVSSYHDLRVCVVDGRIIYSFIRTPGQGDYRAGVATGGKLTVISTDKVPSEVEEIALKVDEVFKQYGHRLYTVDLAFDGEKFWLIELNCQPGLTSQEYYPDYAKTYQIELLELIRNMIKN